MKSAPIFIFAFLVLLLAVPGAYAATETRTVEYFISKQDAQLAINTWWNETFNWNLSDTGATIKSAYFDIYGAYEAAGTTDATINIYLNNTLMRATVMESQTEAYLAHIIANATDLFYTDDLATLSNYQFALKNGAANVFGGISARLVVTYEYTSPPKTKTLKYYINNSLGAVAASAWNNATFALKLNGTNPIVKSAFFEVTQMTPGTADTTLTYYLNNSIMSAPVIGGTAPSYSSYGFANATATTPSGGIYGITDTAERFYQFALKCGAGNTCEGNGAILTVTYESDAEAPIETSSFYVNSTAAQIAANGWFNTTYWLNLTDPSPKVMSAFIVVKGMLATAATATSISVYLNNTLLGTTPYVATIELANFLIIHNASTGSNNLFYTPNGSGPTNMQVSIKCVSGACEAVSAEVFLTYEYSTAAGDSTPPQFSLSGANATSVAPSGAVLLYSNWSDATDLQWAMLETNETGSAANKTGSPTAPVQINLTGTNSWSNFSWINASISGGTEVAWRIFGNDSAGNRNVTGLATFRIFQQITQPIEQSLTINFQNQNIQTLFQVIRNAISATLQVDKATTFMKSANNAITANSGFVSFATFIRSVSNAVTQNLGVQTVSSILRAINQAITSSIAVTSITSIFRSISNALTTNSVVGPLNNLFRIISQAVTTNTVLTTSKGFLTTISQAITQNAVVQTAVTYARIISQELTPNSIATRVGSILRPISQAVTQNAVVQSVSSIFRSISQAITQNLAAKTITSIFRSISQTLTANTANQILNSIFRSISQAVTQNSATLTANSIFRSVSEAVTNNAIVKTTSSILRTISQAVTANALTKTAGSFFKIISQTITSNAVAQSFRSLLVSISQAITQNLSVSKLGNYFKIISQSISPQAQGGGFRIARYFFISVSQSISHHFNAVLGLARVPPHPTASEVAVFMGGGPGLGQTRIIPAVPIKPLPTAAMQFLKQPVLREVVRGQPVVEGIIVKNTGEKTFNLEAEVSGIPERWVTILPSEAELEPGEKKGFTLFITPPKDAEVGDYSVVVSLNGDGISDKTVFILRVKQPPAVQEKVSFERAVSIDKEKESSEIVLNVKNGAEVQKDVSIVENIKKEVANTTDDVIFSEPPDEIIQKDPIVRWKIKELKPYEAKNFTYTVKTVLLEFSPYVYWPAEQISRKNVSGLTVAPLVPIELSAGKANPAPLFITNNLNVSRNVSATMILPEGWTLSPTELNYNLEPSETKIFKFNILLPQNAYPGYYTGKVLIKTDEGEIIKDYEFAVLSNFELLIRPIVIVVSAFFVLGVLWLRLKVMELKAELEEIKSLTEVRKTKEEIEADMAKTKKAIRDLNALYRENVISEGAYEIEKSNLKSRMDRLENEMERLRKTAKEEKPELKTKVRKVSKEMAKFSGGLEMLEEDYQAKKISKKFYQKEKKNLEARLARLQKDLAGNKPLFEEIKKLMQNRKLLIKGLQRIKLAYNEGLVDKHMYKSAYEELAEKIRKIDSVLRKKYGMLQREKEKMVGSNIFLKFADQIKL